VIELVPGAFKVQSLTYLSFQVYIQRFEDRAQVAWVQVLLEGRLRFLDTEDWGAGDRLSLTLRHLCEGGDKYRAEIMAFGLRGV
jgi:hypothetical protein